MPQNLWLFIRDCNDDDERETATVNRNNVKYIKDPIKSKTSVNQFNRNPLNQIRDFE